MDKYDFVVYGFFISVGVAVFFGIRFLVHDYQKQMAKTRTEYQECKEKTDDVEWCIKNVYQYDL